MRRFTLPVLLALLAAALGLGALRAGADQDPPSAGAPAAHPVTPVLSARRIPLFLAAPVADANLRAALLDIVDRSPERTCLVVSSGGRTLFAHNPDVPVTPASAQKLVTATAALEVLGPDTRLRTTVAAQAKPGADGIVEGDLWVVGGGDPLLSTAPYRDHFENQPQIATNLEALADAIVAKGITRISGRIVGDESRYDSERYVAGWPTRFAQQNQSGPLSALSVNDAFARYPEKQFDGAPEETPAEDPPAFAAGTLAVLLQERDVLIVGGAGSGPAPDGAVELAGIDSQPVSQIVREMVSESDNQTAELLTKEMGRVRTGTGSTAAGVGVINETMVQLGLATEGSIATDGSGLDASNQVTCGLLTAVLERTGRESPAAEGMAVAGETGTLAKRFLNSPARGLVRGKTGTLNDVTALAGYADTLQLQSLTFAYVANGRTVTERFQLVQEDLGAILIRYPEGPPLGDLGPTPVG